MYHHTVHNDSTPQDTFLESFIKFSHLLIRRSIKVLRRDKAIFDTFYIEMYHYIVQNGSTALD